MCFTITAKNGDTYISLFKYRIRNLKLQVDILRHISVINLKVFLRLEFCELSQ